MATKLLPDASIPTQRHAACALWGLTEGKEGVFDKEVVEAGAVQPLSALRLQNHVETRGFAAACLSCCCADETARNLIAEHGGAAADDERRWRWRILRGEAAAHQGAAACHDLSLLSCILVRVQRSIL